MAITRGAKKAIRVSKRKKVFNDRRMKALRDSVKEIKSLISGGKRKEAEKLLPLAYKAIDKAAKNGTIKKNAASRKKSRLVMAINKIK